MSAAVRWGRLVANLAAAGVAAEVSEQPYPGGVSRSILLRRGDLLIEVNDTWWPKNPDVWTGYEVHTEGRRDSIVRSTWPRTKKRSEVVAAVLEASGIGR